MITVACMFWHDERMASRLGYRYGPSHVALLQAQVRRHLARQHRFVCITDNRELLEAHGIATAQLDRRTHLPGKRTAKLMLFRPDLGERLEASRVLYLDLDTVIVGALDPLVDRGEDLVLWENPHYGERPQWAPFNSSVMLIRAGAHPEIYERFKPLEGVRTKWSSDDQDWISTHAPPHVGRWSDKDGIWNQSRLPRPWQSGGSTSVLPEGARIVCFPGKRDPSQPEVVREHPWIKRHRVL